MPYNKKYTGIPSVDKTIDDIYDILNKTKGTTIIQQGGSGFPSDLQIRGKYDAPFFRLEVYHNGEWKTILETYIG